MRKNKIVVMDESTANVDVVTEAMQLKMLKEELKDATVITIAHRLNTIISSDQIICLHEGEVKEAGSPEELLRVPHSELNRLL